MSYGRDIFGWQSRVRHDCCVVNKCLVIVAVENGRCPDHENLTVPCPVCIKYTGRNRKRQDTCSFCRGRGWLPADKMLESSSLPADDVSFNAPLSKADSDEHPDTYTVAPDEDDD